MEIRKNPYGVKNALWAVGILLTGLMPARVDAQIFGVRAGFGLATMHVEGDEEPYPMVGTGGFQLGVSLDVPAYKSLTFETGVWLSRKGGGYDRLGVNPNLDLAWYYTRWNTYWIDVPILGRASFPVGNIDLYGEFGLQASFGMGGRYTVETRYGGASSEYSVPIAWNFGEKERNLVPFDVGLLFGVGAQFDRFRVGANLGWGQWDVNNGYSNHYNALFNRALSLYATYLLNPGKAEE